MHNFLPVDGNGRRDLSVLSDPAARDRATEHLRSISNYREDVESLRLGTTVISRRPGGLVRDSIDHLRGPVPAGEPARREQEDAERGRGNKRTSLNVQNDDVLDERSGVQLAQESGGIQQDHVGRLLAAAKSGDLDAIRTATNQLQGPPIGRAWQQRVESAGQQLAQEQAAQQHSAPQQDMGRQV